MRESDSCPELPFHAWSDTCATLHLWTQIVGKVRLALSPAVNHWWHVPFYAAAFYREFMTCLHEVIS